MTPCHSSGPTSLTLRPNRTRHLLYLVFSLALVGLGTLLLDESRVMAGFNILFFGLMAAVFAVGLLPGSRYLRLAPEGFTFCSLYRAWTVRWQDVDGFHVVRVAGQDWVGWGFVPGCSGEARGRALSRRLSGAEAALPDLYGHGAEDLARLMNHWHQAHVAVPATRAD